MTGRPDVDHVLAFDPNMPDAMTWSRTAPDPTLVDQPAPGELAWFTSPHQQPEIGAVINWAAWPLHRRDLGAQISRVSRDMFEAYEAPSWTVPWPSDHIHTIALDETSYWEAANRLLADVYRGRHRRKYTRGPFASPRPAPDMADYHRRRKARARRRRR